MFGLPPKITVGVHPVDLVQHPTYLPGWRWCVMLGHGAWHEMERCVQAGWSPTMLDAQLTGEQCGVTACEAMRRLGIPCEWGGSIILDHDPIPASADDLPLVDDYRSFV